MTRQPEYRNRVLERSQLVERLAHLRHSEFTARFIALDPFIQSLQPACVVKRAKELARLERWPSSDSVSLRAQKRVYPFTLVS